MASDELISHRCAQTVHVAREGIGREAVISWRLDQSYFWVVEIVSAGFGTAQARADDAFEALCLIRSDPTLRARELS